MLHRLPNDVLLYNVFSLLDGFSIINLSLVSKYFNYLINNDEQLWKKLCVQEFNISHDNAYRYKHWKLFYLALKSHTQLHLWGENFDGRLGLPENGQHGVPVSDHSQDRLIYPIVRRGPIQVTTPFHASCLDNKSIVDIVVGGWSFHALDAQGRVWTWGAMQQRISSRFSIGTTRLEKPTLLATSIRFKSISSGRGHVIGLAKDGTVWHWSNHLVIQKVNIDVKIVQVVANWSYSTILSEEGAIYVVPRPKWITSISTQPEPTDILTKGIQAKDVGEPQDRIVQIAGLDGFTLILTRFGRVIKLDTTNYPIELNQATVLEYFSSCKNEYNDRNGIMKRFISGGFHNFAVYTKDKVMLGTIHATNETRPKKIPELENQDICKVTFGDYHFGALTNQGRLLTWGNYSSGALGQGKLVNHRDYVPKYVESLNDKFVFAIGFGGWQSAALTINKIE